MIQKVFNWKQVLSLGILALSLSNCQPTKNVQPTTYYSPNYQSGGYDQHTGLGFQIPDKYPIEILQGNEQPKTSFQEIEKLSIFFNKFEQLIIKTL